MTLRSLVEVTDVPESFNKLIELFIKSYLLIRQQRYWLGHDTV